MDWISKMVVIGMLLTSLFGILYAAQYARERDAMHNDAQDYCQNSFNGSYFNRTYNLDEPICIVDNQVYYFKYSKGELHLTLK